MYMAEDLALIAKKQEGSRKMQAADDWALNKVLTFDMARFPKKTLSCSNDAKACYSCSAHTVASLAGQTVGVPPKPVMCMFVIMQQMCHHIRMLYSNSELSFLDALWVVPILEDGQANGAAPQIWALLSTPLLHILHKEGFGVISLRKRFIV